MKVRNIFFFVMSVVLIVGAVATESVHYKTLDRQRDQPSSGGTTWVLLPEPDFTIEVAECAFIAGSLLCIFSATSFAYGGFKRLRKKHS